jgi:hypothetical protein
MLENQENAMATAFKAINLKTQTPSGLLVDEVDRAAVLSEHLDAGWEVETFLNDPAGPGRFIAILRNRNSAFE